MSEFKFQAAIPVLRMFDVARTKEFYLDFLGCTLDWEHRFEPALPLYMQVSLFGLKLHLSEHYGDGTPGSVVYIAVDNIAEYLKILHAKQTGFARPDPNALEANITDPSGNVLRFDGSD